MKGLVISTVAKIVLAIICIVVGYLIFAWIVSHFPTLLDWICNIPVIEGIDYCKGWKEIRAIQQYHLYPGEEDAIIEEKGYIVRKGGFVEYDEWNEETPSPNDLKIFALHCPDDYGQHGNPFQEDYDNEVCHVFVRTKEANYLYTIFIVPLCLGELKPLDYNGPLVCESGGEALQIRIRKSLVPDVTKPEESIIAESSETTLKEGDTFNWDKISFTLLKLKGREDTSKYEFDWKFEFKGEEAQIGCCQFSPYLETVNCDMVTKEECEQVYQGSWFPDKVCKPVDHFHVCVSE